MISRKLTIDDITPAKIEWDAAFLRGLLPLSVPESEAAARRLLEKVVELGRPLEGSELRECVNHAREAVAGERTVKLDPERRVEYDK